jgi:hypothetical protein
VPQPWQSKPVTGHQLSDPQRVAILDERLNLIMQSKHMNNRIEWRQGYQAIVVSQGRPLTLWQHFGGLCLTLISFGLGLIVWIFMIWASSPSRITRVLFEVPPDGKITRRKLSKAA